MNSSNMTEQLRSGLPKIRSGSEAPSPCLSPPRGYNATITPRLWMKSHNQKVGCLWNGNQSQGHPDPTAWVPSTLVVQVLKLETERRQVPRWRGVSSSTWKKGESVDPPGKGTLDPANIRAENPPGFLISDQNTCLLWATFPGGSLPGKTIAYIRCVPGALLKLT